ncbi:MAG: FixH family protein [Pseudomonadota bacterium]
MTPALTSMVLASALLSACTTRPVDLDISLDKTTQAGLYRISLTPPERPPAINQMHSWKIKLATQDGVAVKGATFMVDGGMPQHGHGLPTQPRITAAFEDGTYTLEGMKFSMSGWWEIKLALAASQGPDTVTFNTVVSTPKPNLLSNP